MDLSIKDNRGSSPLHWACYSKSEIAMCYILSWTSILDDKDIDGFTPLHLAVRSVDSLKSSRPVRSLLIRGARRDITDKNARTPMDLADSIQSELLRTEVQKMLRIQRDCSCLMLKTPLKLMRKSAKTSIFFCSLFLFNYLLLLVLVFPCNTYLTFIHSAKYRFTKRVSMVFLRHCVFCGYCYFLLFECLLRPWLLKEIRNCPLPCNPKYII